jgi:hypothetical protein
MARPRTAKKSDPAPPATRRVLPVELQLGDRLTDETGEWEIIGFTTNGGKDVHARVQKVGQPDATEIRTWSAHERASVSARTPRRASDDAPT